jgi:hypothetical protein
MQSSEPLEPVIPEPFDNNKTINVEIKDSNGNTINPATKEETTIVGATGLPLQQNDIGRDGNGELFVFDTNLNKVFGSSPVNDGSGKIFVKTINNVTSKSIQYSGTNSEVSVDVTGYSTCAIQLSGQWAGTHSFEGTSDTGNWIAMSGMNLSNTSPTYVTSSNGIYIFNVSGLSRIRVRFSTYTSGITIVSFRLSSGPINQSFVQSGTGILVISGAVTESTIDTNLPYIAPSLMYQTGFELESIRVSEPTVNPTQPTTYAAPKFSRYPQKFRRIRVESAGSERLPFAQEASTNRMIVSAPELYRILEEILVEIRNTNDILEDQTDKLTKPSYL